MPVLVYVISESKVKYRLIKQFPNSGLELNEVIELPDSRYVYADENETPCGDEFFTPYPEYFEKVD